MERGAWMGAGPLASRNSEMLAVPEGPTILTSLSLFSSSEKLLTNERGQQEVLEQSL